MTVLEKNRLFTTLAHVLPLITRSTRPKQPGVQLDRHIGRRYSRFALITVLFPHAT
jgi:hypothetical protein